MTGFSHTSSNSQDNGSNDESPVIRVLTQYFAQRKDTSEPELSETSDAIVQER